MDFSFALKDLWPFGVVFARWVAMASVLPAFGDSTVSSRMRLLFALGLSVCVAPALQERGLLSPHDISVLVLLHEIVVGIFLGTLIRIAFDLLEVLGHVISHHSALANAFTSHVASKQQASLPGSLLSMAFLALFLVNDMHHGLLKGVVASYQHFPISGSLFTEDMAHMIVKTLSQGFQVSLMMSGPFIVFGMVFFMTLGLMNRLVPQIQVFFVAQPLEIGLGLLLFMVALPNILTVFSDFISGLILRLSGG